MAQGLNLSMVPFIKITRHNKHTLHLDMALLDGEYVLSPVCVITLHVPYSTVACCLLFLLLLDRTP